MASITARKRKDGSIAFLAQIIRRNPKYQESRTFDKRKSAEVWAKKREREIDADITAGRTPRKLSAAKVTLGHAIDKYIAESMVEIGKTKTQVLRTIRDEYRLSEMACDRITSPDIVTFVKELHLRPGLNSPSTAGNYLSHLSGVFSTARPLWGFQLDAQAMKDAQKVCSTMGFISKPKERQRRPTLEELDKLMTLFHRSTKADSRTMPMHILTAFAIFSTRRQAEICRITWADYESETQRVLVRKMKNPGEKGGIDTWVDLPDPAPAIIETMPRTEDRIFPYHSNTVSRRFTDACKLLGIQDLHFHDLRHEGTSRLAEMGRTTPQLASATGHKSWKSLERYTHIHRAGDKFLDWEWKNEILGPPLSQPKSPNS